jgi:hypothetical protein
VALTLSFILCSVCYFVGLLHSPWMVFYEFVTPNAGWFSNHSVLLLIVAVLSGKYSEVFLNIKGHSKTIYILFNIAYTLLFSLLVSVVFFHHFCCYGFGKYTDPSILIVNCVFYNLSLL